MAQDDRRRSVRQVLLVGEPSAVQRCDANRAHERCRHTRGGDLLRFGATRQRQSDRRHGSKRRERSRLRLERLQLGEADRGLSDSRICVVDVKQRPGIRVRQRPQEHRVHHAEDRRVGADAERERKDGGDGEGRLPEERSRAVFEVLPEGLHATGRVKVRATRIWAIFSQTDAPCCARAIARSHERDSAASG